MPISRVVFRNSITEDDTAHRHQGNGASDMDSRTLISAEHQSTDYSLHHSRFEGDYSIIAVTRSAQQRRSLYLAGQRTFVTTPTPVLGITWRGWLPAIPPPPWTVRHYCVYS